MQLYYDDKGIEILHGDCLEIMPALPSQLFDAVICDPPYGTTACAWDSVIPFDAMWKELKRLIKPRGAIVLFASQPFTSALVMSNPGMFKYEWVWRKNTPSHPGNSRFMPMRYHENILVFCESQPVYNPIATTRFSRASIERNRYPVGNSNKKRAGVSGEFFPIIKQYDSLLKGPESVLEFRGIPNAGDGRLHPTQKPLALMEYLVKTYTNPGDRILDFCAGSGTTLRAAKNLGRECVGIEKELEYCRVAVSRLAPAFEEAIVDETAVEDLGPLFQL